ncbi:MAG: PorT family protein [Bacteroidales bacterium]|nr:PorT family protein [Bacteroidales bacterium]
MKKTFIILAALIVLSGSIFAQGFDLSIGPKVGYQTAKLSYHKEDIKSGFAEHFTIGAFARVEIGNLYVQPEILWFKSSNVFDLNTNVTHDTIIGDITIPSRAKLDFTLKAMNIQVPILVGYKFNVIDGILAIRPQVGPTLNFVIPQQTLVNQSIGSADPTEIDKETFDTKSIAFGLQGGLGFDVLNFTLDINYNFGISKVFGANIINNTSWGQYIDTNNISDAHNNMFMVTLGYKFL